MGFDTDSETVYQIRPLHRNEEVREIMRHILRNLTDVVESKQGRAREFGVKAKVLLQDGMELWRARDSLVPGGICREGGGDQGSGELSSARPYIDG